VLSTALSFTLSPRIFSAPTPTPGTPRATSPALSPHLAPQGPSQLLTALLVRLPDATNRALIDQAAIDFAFLNSKAARKRLVKVYFSRTIRSIQTQSALVLGPSPQESDGFVASLRSLSCDTQQVYAGYRH
jgi:hypothetical protein